MKETRQCFGTAGVRREDAPPTSVQSEPPVITRVTELSRARLALLLAESEAAGYRFVRRLIDEWEQGINCFSRPGEALFAAEIGGQIVGVCGLNVDPYLSDPCVGRVRNVYVLATCRGRGIGGQLVDQAIESARGHFHQLRLRGEQPGPARLYESLGFRPYSAIPNCTHILELGGCGAEKTPTA
jgi:GNAT superfamily N-acetyltransferase